jgi:hypothetical protein
MIAKCSWHKGAVTPISLPLFLVRETQLEAAVFAPCPVLQKLKFTGLSSTAATWGYNSEAAKPSEQTVKATDTAPKKCSTVEDLVTFTATAQHVMTELRSAQTEDGRFTIITKTVYVIMRMWRSVFAVSSESFAFLFTSDPSTPHTGGTM